MELARAAGERRGCLFCRKSDGVFISREHVFPEALGNTEIILQPGVVCDHCNNGTLSSLDQSVCDFMPVKLKRTVFGVPSKAGRIPKCSFSEGTVEHVPGAGGADPTLILNPSSRRDIVREIERSPDGRVTLEWNASGGDRTTPRYASKLSRALLKAALECAWLEHGEMILEPRFDHVREAVLGQPRDGFLAIGKKINSDSLQMTLGFALRPHEDDTWGMLVWADYYGVSILTDSRLPRPLITPPADQVNLIAFAASDLRQRRDG
jgi:HNH endonuclease